MNEPSRRQVLTGAWRTARMNIVAAVAAHAVVCALSTMPLPSMLLPALAASLVYAGVVLQCEQRTVPVPAFSRASATLSLSIEVMLGRASAFYCAPPVPWHVGAALLGSFFLGLVVTIGRARWNLKLPLAASMVALWWMAPFYGYFSGPVFLAIQWVTDCPGRSFQNVGFGVVALVTGRLLGGLLATWLVGTADDLNQQGGSDTVE